MQRRRRSTRDHAGAARTASNASAVGLVSTLNEQSIADPYPAVPMFSRLAPMCGIHRVHETVGPLDSIVWQGADRISLANR